MSCSELAKNRVRKFLDNPDCFENLQTDEGKYLMNNFTDIFCKFVDDHPDNRIMSYFIENTKNIKKYMSVSYGIEILSVLKSFEKVGLVNTKDISRILLYSLVNDNNDIVDYIIDNYNNIIYLVHKIKFKLNLNCNTEILRKVLNAFPNFFENIENWNICCNLDSAKELRVCGKLHLVYPPSLLKEDDGLDFIKDCQSEMNIRRYLEDNFEFHKTYTVDNILIYSISDENYVIEFSRLLNYVKTFRNYGGRNPPCLDILMNRYNEEERKILKSF